MFSLVKRLLGLRHRTRNSSTSTGKQSFRPTLEALEDRRLLSASAVISNSVLVIQGTDAHERISVVPVVGSPMVQVKISNIDPNTHANIGSPVLDKQFLTAKFTKIEMYGYGGNDVLSNATAIPSDQRGGFGNDTLYGGFANDTLYGGGDNDTYMFSNPDDDNLGTDTIGEGLDANDTSVDTLDFSGMQGGVTIDLALANTVQTVVPGQLSLKLTNAGGIENVIGSNFNDWLRGNARNNTLDGRADADFLEGRQGDDVLIGGAGNDHFDFGNPNKEYLGADTVNESLGVNDDSIDYLVFNLAGSAINAVGGLKIDLGLANTMQEVVYGQLKLTLTDANGIEGVYGTNGAGDVIKGNARDNHLFGLGGNDTLYGFGGNDYLEGGPQNDYVYGGDGDDTLLGSDGDDHLYGEAGTDTLWGGLGADFLNGGFDGCQDKLYGNNPDTNSDGAVDTLIQNGYTSGYGNQPPEDLVYGDSLDIIQ
jgi:Ca2+-binding RTX toxin-like protein